jgi:hypothetical protein
MTKYLTLRSHRSRLDLAFPRSTVVTLSLVEMT